MDKYINKEQRTELLHTTLQDLLDQAVKVEQSVNGTVNLSSVSLRVNQQAGSVHGTGRISGTIFSSKFGEKYQKKMFDPIE